MHRSFIDKRAALRFRWREVVILSVCLGLAPAYAAEPPRPNRIEPGVLPVLGQDADIGTKLGAYVQLVGFSDDQKPFAWRGQLFAAASVLDGASGTELPYREAFLRLDRPHIFIDRLRILVHLGYLRTTNLGYYGIGNATPAEQVWLGLAHGSPEYVTARRYYQFDGVSPMARLIGRYMLVPGWEAMVEADALWVDINVYAGSLLERDLSSSQGAPFPLGRGAQFRGALGLIHDTRNHETVPTRGYFHEGSIRCGSGSHGDGSHCALNVILRGYWELAGERLSIATRLLGDVELGNPPLLELARYGGLDADNGPGGARGIRGVPQGRLAGKSKVIGNLELRSLFLPFTIKGQRFSLGAAAFADAGRVWAGAFSSSENDGSFRMHWGAGGGPRVRWGDSLLIRFDVAYAPLGADLGAAPAVYIDVKQLM